MVPISFFIKYVTTHSGELVRFAVVGTATLLVNVLAVSIFYGLLRDDYRIAISLSYIVTVCCHFTLNKMFTFGAAEHKLIRSAPRYGMMLVLNYLITLTCSWLSVGIIGTSPYVAVIASTCGTAVSSFYVMKYYVFGQGFRASSLVNES